MPKLHRILWAIALIGIFSCVSCSEAADQTVKEIETKAEIKAEISDTLIHDQWFNGYLNQQPALNGHEVIIAHGDQTRTFTFDMEMRISRSLLGIKSVMSMTQKRSFRENQDGLIDSFYFEDNQDGKIITATGKIVEDIIHITITTPTGILEKQLSIPKDVRLLGQLGGQAYINEQLKKVDDQTTISGIEMISGQVKIMSSTGTLKEIKANGNKVFNIVVDLMPTVPVSIEVDRHGYTQALKMSLAGIMSLDFNSAEQRMPLEAAEFNIAKLIRHTGGTPLPNSNRYRMKPEVLAFLQNDDFQFGEAGILTVNNKAKPSPLANQQAFLAAELQLETEDPNLSQWAKSVNVGKEHKSIAAQAETLRLAVRSYITRKDLSQGDASALETFKSRRGDCTEHANLLCAALRINGIPSRTEVGFVYATQTGSWVGHAWTSAYDHQQECWIHLDAAYPGIPRSHYIKTGTTSGDETQGTGAAMATGLSTLMGQEVEVLKP